jgi:hypothetical protein
VPLQLTEKNTYFFRDHFRQGCGRHDEHSSLIAAQQRDFFRLHGGRRRLVRHVPRRAHAGADAANAAERLLHHGQRIAGRAGTHPTCRRAYFRSRLKIDVLSLSLQILHGIQRMLSGPLAAYWEQIRTGSESHKNDSVQYLVRELNHAAC